MKAGKVGRSIMKYLLYKEVIMLKIKTNQISIPMCEVSERRNDNKNVLIL